MTRRVQRDGQELVGDGGMLPGGGDAHVPAVCLPKGPCAQRKSTHIRKHSGNKPDKGFYPMTGKC